MSGKERDDLRGYLREMRAKSLEALADDTVAGARVTVVEILNYADDALRLLSAMKVTATA